MSSRSYAAMHTPPSTQQLAELIERNFPPIHYGFAYGSGVFLQPDLYKKSATGASSTGPMLDFVLVVDDPVGWHTHNIQHNSSHYSLLKYFGPTVVCKVADNIGVGVYFNTLVPVEGKMIKYGVIGKNAFEQDLRHWSQVYISGRLHKPVAAFNQTAESDAAQQHNLRSALITALLLSPKASTLKDFFKRITSLSYLGDVRMGLAEDSKKVERIVAGSYDSFKELYLPMLQNADIRELGVVADTDGLQQDDSLDSRMQLFSKLPSVLIAQVAKKLGPLLPDPPSAAAAAVLTSASASVSAALPPVSIGTRLDIAAAAVGSAKYKKLIKAGLHAIVANSSRRQAVAGLLYAGPVRSLQYVGRKLVKAWR